MGTLTIYLQQMDQLRLRHGQNYFQIYLDYNCLPVSGFPDISRTFDILLGPYKSYNKQQSCQKNLFIRRLQSLATISLHELPKTHDVDVMLV